MLEFPLGFLGTLLQSMPGSTGTNHSDQWLILNILSGKRDPRTACKQNSWFSCGVAHLDRRHYSGRSSRKSTLFKSRQHPSSRPCSHGRGTQLCEDASTPAAPRCQAGTESAVLRATAAQRCTSVEGLLVFMRWHLGLLRGNQGAP